MQLVYVIIESTCYTKLLLTPIISVQLSYCINGASSIMELWTCVSRYLCFAGKKRPPKSSPS